MNRELERTIRCPKCGREYRDRVLLDDDEDDDFFDDTLCDECYEERFKTNP
jgi:hypothetical protein